MENPKRLLHEPHRWEFSDKTKNTKQQVLGFIWVWSTYLWSCVCICMCVYIRKLCTDSHLFENQELIQEVNTLAGEEFPDGLLSLEALRVRGGAHLGRLVPQELRQRVVLHTDGKKRQITALARRNNYQERLEQGHETFIYTLECVFV